MKKIILSLLICLCANLTISAQIQRTFFGLTLGVSTKSDVEKYFREHGAAFDEKKECNHIYNKLKWAGTEWNSVSFTLYENKLLQIAFECNEFSCTKKTLDLMWDDYSNKLYSKYAHFYSNTSSSPIMSTYADKETILFITHGETVGISTLDIVYFDIELFSKKNKKVNSEL